jgi:8-oxo-dGTP pyrophosphatase MutT (NUDIX family)
MPLPPFIQHLRQKIGHDLLLLPGVCGLVFNDAGEILLHRRSDFGIWAVIGGVLEPGEEPADAVVREVLEETGVVCEPQRVTGVYITPTITYPNGDRCQYVITTFRCRYISGQPCVNDDESLDVRFFPVDALPEMRPDLRVRVEHAIGDDPSPAFHYRGDWRRTIAP